MYLFLLFMRVLLSWFPSIDWNAQPWTFLRLVSASVRAVAVAKAHVTPKSFRCLAPCVTLLNVLALFMPL